MVATIWLDSTATVRNQQHFDDVSQRKYYVDMFRLQAPIVSDHFSKQGLRRVHRACLDSFMVILDGCIQ